MSSTQLPVYDLSECYCWLAFNFDTKLDKSPKNSSNCKPFIITSGSSNDFSIIFGMQSTANWLATLTEAPFANAPTKIEPKISPVPWN